MGLSPRVIVLAICVAALAVWLFVFELPREQVEQERISAEQTLMDFDPTRVEALRVLRADAPWVLTRREDPDGGEPHWWLVEPIEERADPRLVENALTLLLSFTSVRRIADDVSEDAWNRYGLSDGHPSRADFVVNLSDGSHQVLHVGTTDPSGNFVFVRRAGSDALDLAYVELGELAYSPHHGFRRTRMFEVKPGEIARLELAGPNYSWSVERDQDSGLWWSELATERVRLRRWELDELAYFIAESGVLIYQRDGLTGAQWSGYGLEDPWASVTWTSFDGRSGQLDLGNETEPRRYFGRRSGLDSVFEVEPGFENVFDRDPRTWVDDNPIPRNVRRVQVIRIEDANGDWVQQERTGALQKDWAVTTERGAAEPTEYLYVSARNVALGLEELQTTSTLLLAQGEQADAGDPGRRGPRVILTWEDGPDVELVLWWRSEDSAPWLQIDGTPVLHRVGRGIFMRLRAMIDAAHVQG